MHQFAFAQQTSTVKPTKSFRNFQGSNYGMKGANSQIS